MLAAVEDIIYIGISALLVIASGVLLVVAVQELLGAKFRDQLWEIGVLGVVVPLLGVTAWPLRLKEREPDEVAGASSPSARPGDQEHDT